MSAYEATLEGVASTTIDTTGQERAPIACTLSPRGMTHRRAEWRALVASRVTEVTVVAGLARLRLADGPGAWGEAIDLARREASCCGFFSFRLALGPDAVWLEIEAPPEAASLVSELVGVPTP